MIFYKDTYKRNNGLKYAQCDLETLQTYFPNCIKCISTVIVNLCYTNILYYIYVHDYENGHFVTCLNYIEKQGGELRQRKVLYIAVNESYWSTTEFTLTLNIWCSALRDSDLIFPCECEQAETTLNLNLLVPCLDGSKRIRSECRCCVPV